MTSLLLLAALSLGPDSLHFSGLARQLEVTPPRVEEPQIRIDGILGEDAWNNALIK